MTDFIEEWWPMLLVGAIAICCFVGLIFAMQNDAAECAKLGGKLLTRAVYKGVVELCLSPDRRILDAP